MKKLVAMLMIGTMTLSFAACGGGNDETTQESTQATETQMESTVATETVEASAEASTEAVEGGDVALEGWSTEMESIKTAVVETLGENYWPNTPISADILEGTYGITSDMYDDYLAEMPMISVNVDTLLIIKAKDGMVESVEEALNAYREAIVSDTMQYPMNVGKIQASRIETIGNYVCFVQLGADTMTASESGDEAVVAQCQEANELAIEVIRQNIPE